MKRSARRGWRPGEVSDHTVRNGETAAGIENDALGTAGDANSIERYAVYGDVATHGIDGDPVSANWRCDVGPTLTLDSDGLADCDWAVAGRVKRIDFTPGTGRVHCGLEMTARRGEATRIAVIACRRNEGAGSLSLCGYGWQNGNERERRRQGDDGTSHWNAPLSALNARGQF
jgi:hypothetical protein